MKSIFDKLALLIIFLVQRITFDPRNWSNVSPSIKGSIKFSALMTGIKGKIGGSVFQGSKTGFMLKNKPSGNYVKPIKWLFGSTLTYTNWNNSQQLLLNLNGGLLAPDGSCNPYPFQFSTQQLIRQISKSWQNLEATDRAAWNAAAPSFPFTDRWGSQYTGSGFQVFMSINSKLMPFGIALQTLPPSPSDGDLPDWPWNTIYINSNPSASDFMQLQIPDGIAPGALVLVKASPAQSNGKIKTVFGGKGQCVVSTEEPSTVELLPQYNMLFGTLPPNSATQLEVSVINSSNGHTIYTNTFQVLVPVLDSATVIRSVYSARQISGSPAEVQLSLNWNTTSASYDLGAQNVDVESDSFFYAITILQVGAFANIQFAKSGANQADYAISYNGNNIPNSGTYSTTTDQYGNLSGIPLLVIVDPSAPGVRTCSITITVAGIVTPIVLTFTCTAS